MIAGTMKPGLREHGPASLKVRVAKALPQKMRANVFEITSVRTEPEYRGRGHARSLMLDTCLEADLAGKFLLVHVEPDPDSPIDEIKLSDFYAGLGFRPLQSSPVKLMIRPCVGKLHG